MSEGRSFGENFDDEVGRRINRFLLYDFHSFLPYEQQIRQASTEATDLYGGPRTENETPLTLSSVDIRDGKQPEQQFLMIQLHHRVLHYNAIDQFYLFFHREKRKKFREGEGFCQTHLSVVSRTRSRLERLAAMRELRFK